MVFVRSDARMRIASLRIPMESLYHNSLNKKGDFNEKQKRGLIIIILASFAILADIALFILEKSGYMVGHEQPPLYYIGGVAIGVILLLMGIHTYRKGN